MTTKGGAGWLARLGRAAWRPVKGLMRDPLEGPIEWTEAARSVRRLAWVIAAFVGLAAFLMGGYVLFVVFWLIGTFLNPTFDIGAFVQLFGLVALGVAGAIGLWWVLVLGPATLYVALLERRAWARPWTRGLGVVQCIACAAALPVAIVALTAGLEAFAMVPILIASIVVLAASPWLVRGGIWMIRMPPLRPIS